MSDRTGRPVGDGPGRLDEHRSSEAQIRILLDQQKVKVLAECQARICQHEFQAARAEDEQRLFQGQLLQQKLELSEVHQQSLTETEIPEFCLRYDSETKIYRRSEHYFGTLWQSTGIAK